MQRATEGRDGVGCGGGAEKPKIRAITAFINLDRAQYQEQVADAVKMLRRAQTVFESRGYEVQTIRIATQPFPEYTKGMTTQQAVAFFKEYDALAQRRKILRPPSGRRC